MVSLVTLLEKARFAWSLLPQIHHSLGSLCSFQRFSTSPTCIEAPMAQSGYSVGRQLIVAFPDSNYTSLPSHVVYIYLGISAYASRNGRISSSSMLAHALRLMTHPRSPLALPLHCMPHQHRLICLSGMQDSAISTIGPLSPLFLSKSSRPLGLPRQFHSVIVVPWSRDVSSLSIVNFSLAQPCHLSTLAWISGRQERRRCRVTPTSSGLPATPRLSHSLFF